MTSTVKYYYMNEEQFKKLKLAYRNDKIFDTLVDIETNQKLDKEKIRNISDRIK